MLWAWQRPEDFAGLDTEFFGIAYLADHVLLRGDEVLSRVRVQPMAVPAGTRMLAVVRVDSDRGRKPSLSPEQAQKLAQLLAGVSALPRAAGVQIDFDAVEDEREFYRETIRQLQKLKPPDRFLSITALASWCMHDNWVKDLRVDETVPMMFSLGRDRDKILLYFRSGRDFLVPQCCRSMGVSLEDSEMNHLMIPLAEKRKIPFRTYVFTRTAWTPQKVAAVRELLIKNEE